MKNFLKKYRFSIIVSTILLILISSSIYLFNKYNSEEISITQTVQKIKKKELRKIVIANRTIYLIEKGSDKEAFETSIEEGATAAQMLKDNGVSDSELLGIEIENDSFRMTLMDLWTWFFLGLMICLMGLIFYAIKGQEIAEMFGGGFGSTGTLSRDIKITFKDIAGNHEAKSELQEVVEFLQHPEKFLKLGATIPKGVLLKGPPGTGKTLLARAISGEAGVPFYHATGSDFVEMYVGVGASRVRSLFAKAKKDSPSIVFIDEIDAIGEKRGSRGSNKEIDQTINALLTEMDGFDNTSRVVVIAATNNPDKLDTALLRRLQRKVFVDLPNRKDRIDILKIHLKGKPISKNIDLAAISKQTNGFSGDSLRILVNEAAIIAANQGSESISQQNLLSGISKVLVGPANKNQLSESELKTVAHHEAGHAVITSLINGNKEVQKVTVLPHGRAGGFVMNANKEDKTLMTKKELINEIKILFGGYVAEELIFGSVTTGPSNDLERANKIARSIVVNYGMDDKIPLFSGMDNIHYSQDLLAKIDRSVLEILNLAYSSAKEMLQKNKKCLVAIAEALIEYKTLDQSEFKEIFENNFVQILKTHKIA